MNLSVETDWRPKPTALAGELVEFCRRLVAIWDPKMKYAVWAVGLLVAPAQGANCTPHGSAKHLPENSSAAPLGEWARRFKEMRKKHPKWSLARDWKTGTGFSPPKKHSTSCGARSVTAKSPRRMRSINTARATGSRRSSRRGIPSPYTQRDCVTIEMLLTACKVSGKRIPTELTKEEQLTLSRRLRSHLLFRCAPSSKSVISGVATSN